MHGQVWGRMEGVWCGHSPTAWTCRAWGRSSAQHTCSMAGGERNGRTKVSSLDLENRQDLTPPFHNHLTASGVGPYRGQQPTSQLSGWGRCLPKWQSVPSLARLGRPEGQRLVGLVTSSQGTSWRAWPRGLPPLALKFAMVGSGNLLFLCSTSPVSSLLL